MVFPVVRAPVELDRGRSAIDAIWIEGVKKRNANSRLGHTGFMAIILDNTQTV